jgi:tRNA-modifying protein YgfZ
MSPERSPKLGRRAQTACIEVTGADATAFLHGQLSQRVERTEHQTAPLAAWSDARGRVRALLRAIPADAGWLLLTDAGRADAVAAQLSRYVLRAAAELRVAAELETIAVLGDAKNWLTTHAVGLAATADATTTAAGVHWLRAGPGLLYGIAPPDRARELATELGAATSDEIELAEIRLGLPSLGAGLQERYVPQMLNLDLLGGIAFDKGCYPGQEIVARTHNLGTLKRRLRRFGYAGGARPALGGAIVTADGEPAGEVIRSAPGAKGSELLAVVRLDLLGDGLFLDADREVALAELELPYA